MENIINIATLTIDTQGASDQIVETRKEIFELQKANVDLRKAIQSGDGDVTEQTRKFVEQEAKIKALQVSFKQQSTALNEYTLENVKNSKALTENSKSIDQANFQNKELIKTRNQLDATTTDGAVAIDLINKKIDQNNGFINQNTSAVEKQKNNVGNYQGALEKADGVLSKFGINGEQARNVISGFTSTVSSGASGIVDYSNKIANAGVKMIGFKTSAMLASEANAIMGVTTEASAIASTQLAAGQVATTTATAGATLGFRAFAVALVATGIGAIVLIIGILISSLSKLDGPMDAIEQATAGLGGAFSKAIDVIANFITSITSVQDGMAKVATFFMNPIESIKTFTKEVGKAYNQAAALKGLEQGLGDLKEVYDTRNKQLQSEIDLNNVRLKSRKLTASQEIEIEKQNSKAFKEISDNKKEVSKKDLDISFTNAVQTSEKLSAIDKKRLAIDLRDGSIKVAQELKNNDIIEESAYKKLLSSVGNQAEINQSLAEQEERNQNKQEKARDRIESQEQKRKEAGEKAFQDSLKQAQNRIDIIKLEGKQTDETAEQKITTLKKVFELEKSLAEKSLSGSDETKKLLEVEQNFSKEVLAIATSTIDGEIELQKKLIETKKSISVDEKNELTKNAEFLRQTERTNVENSLLSERDKKTALLEIEAGFKENVLIINKTFEDSEKLRKEEQEVLNTLEYEMRLVTLEEQGYSESELKLRILEEEHAERTRLLQLQVDSEGNITKIAQAKLTIENKKYAQATKSIDDQLNATKRKAVFGVAQDAIAAAQSIFGENKALAIASALINTYQGISAQIATKPKTPYEIGLVIANSAVVAATGFAAVKNILNTNKGSTGGGGSGGSGVSGASTPSAVFENPAVTTTIATLQNVPANATTGAPQTVLVLETLTEVQNQQQIKINSN